MKEKRRERDREKGETEREWGGEREERGEKEIERERERERWWRGERGVERERERREREGGSERERVDVLRPFTRNGHFKAGEKGGGGGKERER